MCTQKNGEQGLSYLYTTVHSSVIHSSQKVETTQCSSTDESVNKMACSRPSVSVGDWFQDLLQIPESKDTEPAVRRADCIHTVEYYSALKRNEGLPWRSSG